MNIVKEILNIHAIQFMILKNQNVPSNEKKCVIYCKLFLEVLFMERLDKTTFVVVIEKEIH